jgi:hypothetical protein
VAKQDVEATKLDAAQVHAEAALQVCHFRSEIAQLLRFGWPVILLDGMYEALAFGTRKFSEGIHLKRLQN